MQNFTAHRLTFITQAQTTIELHEHQGSALRGALFHALRRKFCAFSRNRNAQCQTCALATTCPVATLVSTLAPGHQRGQDRPRPFTIQPPRFQSGHPWEHSEGRVTFRYEPGETLTFGLTLYASALALFPYVVLATTEFEEGGLGRKCEQATGRWRRGTLVVREVWADNPLTGKRQPVIRQGSRQVQVPDIPVIHAQVLENAARRMQPGAHQLTLGLLTPARIIERGHLLKPHNFRFRPFFQRLLERLEALSGYFSDTPLDVDFPALLAAAEAVQVVDNRLSWEELRSYSTRQHRATSRGGLVGRVTLASADWTPLWPWLVWGQFTHVGKDTVKGNGMYSLENGV
ncbi:MAG: CRISPR system precrRNA processing endoribonuclease RAMP protein Cas6 [Chloroflexota bacterium]|nr:CRISPR system precrRNA processing endoribonuclease RAMP protein Cas6 [Chloroflexota bacterium]